MILAELQAKSVRSQSPTAVTLAEGPCLSNRFTKRLYFYPRPGTYTVVWLRPRTGTHQEGTFIEDVVCLRKDAETALNVFDAL